MSFLKVFIPSLFVPMILDFVWLGLIAKPMYLQELAPIGRIDGGKIVPVLWASGIVYLLIALGTVGFVLPKVGPEGRLGSAFLQGACFGIILYGVYDFTNFAVLKDYTLTITLIDFAWGIILCGVTALTAQWVQSAVK
jgi:uncharacterized membrane protein